MALCLLLISKLIAELSQVDSVCFFIFCVKYLTLKDHCSVSKLLSQSLSERRQFQPLESAISLFHHCLKAID